jgi:hypothetical protein
LFFIKGGWAFLNSKVSEMVGPMIAFLPPQLGDAYFAAAGGLLGPKTLNVSLTPEFTVGIDFSNVDMFSLFPTKAELEEASADE